jgi:hypothetical protein
LARRQQRRGEIKQQLIGSPADRARPLAVAPAQRIKQPFFDAVFVDERQAEFGGQAPRQGRLAGTRQS